LKCPKCGTDVDCQEVADALLKIAHRRDLGINNWDDVNY
jgi:hypothetical protein